MYTIITKSLSISLIFMCLFVLSTFTGDCRAASNGLLVSNTELELLIDGDLSDWNQNEPIILNKNHCSVIGGNVSSDSDLSALLYSSYSDEYLFLAIEVRDDEINTPNRGGALWMNDSVELWFDANSDSGLSGLVGDDDYQIVVSPVSPDGDESLRVYRNKNDAYIYAGTKISSKIKDDGYIIEVAIPFASMSDLDLVDKGFLKFNVSLCDNDGSEFSEILWLGKKKEDTSKYGYIAFGQAGMEKAEDEARTIVDKINDLDTTQVSVNKPAFINFVKIPKSVKLFDKYEIEVDIAADYENPFDFSQVSLQGVFTRPSGKVDIVDGFYYQDYSLFLGYRTGDGMKEDGKPNWQVRYTPTEAGKYQFILTLKDRSGKKVSSELFEFVSNDSEIKGFVRVSDDDPMYLEYDSGESFFGIGYGAHLWSATDWDILRNKHYLSQLAAFDGNYMSINLQCQGGGVFDLEMPCLEVGKYSLRNAYKLDYVLEAASKRGIYIIGCLNQNHALRSRYWSESMYNKLKGGYCTNPEDFFTSNESLQRQYNRYRYTIARWGYSPNILCLELMNEVNYTDGARRAPASVVKWHKDTANYIKSLDVNKHLISTCFGSGDKCENDDIWKLKEIDCLVTHGYSRDIVGEIRPRLLRKVQFNKPNLGGECGMTYPEAKLVKYKDPTGIALHNSLWASTFSHSAGTIMHWWNCMYHDGLDLYEHYRALNRFTEGIEWHKQQFVDVSLTAKKRGVEGYTEGRFPAVAQWNKIEDQNSYKKDFNVYSLQSSKIWRIIQPDINYETDDPSVMDSAKKELSNDLPAIIFNAKHKQYRGDLRLIVNCPSETVMIVPLKNVSNAGANLAVSIDGIVIEELLLKDIDGNNNPYAEEFSDVLKINLPQGRSDIKLRNTGDGWVTIGNVRIKNYVEAGELNSLRIFGLQGPKMAIVWLQNAENTWYLRDLKKQKLKPIEDVYFELENVEPGKYSVEWWDTYEGKKLFENTVKARSKKLRVWSPSFETDIACKIYKIR